jgi:hypothetical protein
MTLISIVETLRVDQTLALPSRLSWSPHSTSLPFQQSPVSHAHEAVEAVPQTVAGPTGAESRVHPTSMTSHRRSGTLFVEDSRHVSAIAVIQEAIHPRDRLWVLPCDSLLDDDVADSWSECPVQTGFVVESPRFDWWYGVHRHRDPVGKRTTTLDKRRVTWKKHQDRARPFDRITWMHNRLRRVADVMVVLVQRYGDDKIVAHCVSPSTDIGVDSCPGPPRQRRADTRDRSATP